MVVLGNPAGLWALASVPVLIALHFLRPKPVRWTATTLFLIQRRDAIATTGARFHRLRTGLPFWLQLAALLSLCWLLVEPRWVREDSSRQIFIVLDSSASMGAWRDRVADRLEPVGAALAAGGGELRCTVMESHPDRDTLLKAGGWDRFEKALDAWRPDLGAHDPSPVLLAALQAAGRSGVCVFVTDQPPETVPSGVRVLAIGEAVPNAGILSVSSDETPGGPTWTALVGAWHPAGGSVSLRLVLRIGNASVPVRSLEIPHGQVERIRGPWPADADRMVLELETEDPLPIDDRAPLVRERPRPLRVWLAEDAPAYAKRLVESLPGCLPSGPEQADLVFAAQPAAGRPSILFRRAAEGEPVALRPGALLAEEHPLTADLSWQGFFSGGALGAEGLPVQQPLLRLGSAPIVFLSEAGGAPQLVLDFDWSRSNAERLPAFFLLLTRFAESVRSSVPGTRFANVDTHQRLGLAGSAQEGRFRIVQGGNSREADAVELPALKASGEPGFIEVAPLDGGEPWLIAASRFADPRESDLTRCSGTDAVGLVEALEEERRRSLGEDPLRPVWILAVLGLALGAWGATSGRSRS